MGQADAVTAVIDGGGSGGELTLRHDLQGIPRVAVAQRP